MLKYATLNQYILKAVRAKMFETKLSSNAVILQRNNKLDEIKNTILNDYYSFNYNGRKNIMPNLTTDSGFSDWLANNLLNRLKQPLRAYKKMNSPYEMVNYNFLQQKALSLYLNNKKKYEKLRFIVKPLQVFFRDYLNHNSDMSKVNYFHRSDKNLINTDITTRFNSKNGLTKAKKLILNSRLQYRKILSN
jgi:hypothetical protein